MAKNKPGGGDGIYIPAYRARALATHLRRIIEKAGCNPSDLRTANALRLAKADLRYIDKLFDYGRR